MASLIFNGHESPVRIHETLTLVIESDGTGRVERNTSNVVGCP